MTLESLNKRVSVIIPVYNAEKYLEEAVQSALSCDEVGEVILVEDKSPDNALSICRKLAKEHQRVTVLRHPNGENRGAGASRNLGIKQASYDLIAFLDADDIYLKNRFSNAVKMLLDDESLDGVYGGTGVFFKNDECKRRFAKSEKINLNKADQYYNNLKDGTDSVLERMLNSKGRFHTNALTLRKSVFDRSGIFNETLRLHQDSELWYRIAYYSRLRKSDETPVAKRRVHEENRVIHVNHDSQFLYYQVLTNYWIDKNISKKHKLRFLKSMIFNLVIIKTGKSSKVLLYLFSIIYLRKFLKIHFFKTLISF